MRRITPATGGDKAAIAEAIGSLRDARTLLHKGPVPIGRAWPRRERSRAPKAPGAMSNTA